MHLVQTTQGVLMLVVRLLLLMMIQQERSFPQHWAQLLHLLLLLLLFRLSLEPFRILQEKLFWFVRLLWAVVVVVVAVVLHCS